MSLTYQQFNQALPQWGKVINTHKTASGRYERHANKMVFFIPNKPRNLGPGSGKRCILDYSTDQDWREIKKER